MFFIMGISQGQKQLDFNQTIICSICGKYARYEVFMTYMYFSLFFIPLFKWNKKYYVKTSCCGSVYELNPEVGKAIAKGEEVEIYETDMILESRGSGHASFDGRQQYDRSYEQEENREKKICSSCGYETEADFEYCPKCGKKL